MSAIQHFYILHAQHSACPCRDNSYGKLEKWKTNALTFRYFHKPRYYNTKKMNRHLLIIFILALSVQSLAQTCCSGGVPLSSNLGLPDGETGALQFTLSYDVNALNTLKNGTIVLKDDAGLDRTRLTHSMLFELGYTISPRWSIDLFFSWVRQERTNFTNNIETDFRFTEGIGDPVFLLKYKLIASNAGQTSLTAGVGAKPPIGSANESFEGFRLNADLQPGSGAWDGILWSQFTQTLGFRQSLSFVATASYRFRGTNEDFQATINPVTGERNAQPYRFGKEFQLITGLSDRLILGKQLFDPALLLRYRHAAADRIKSDLASPFNEIPNTGGQWIFINPSISYWLGTKASINANFELPLYANITGTQVSPTYRLNIGFYYKIDGKQSNDLIQLQ